MNWFVKKYISKEIHMEITELKRQIFQLEEYNLYLLREHPVPEKREIYHYHEVSSNGSGAMGLIGC